MQERVMRILQRFEIRFRDPASISVEVCLFSQPVLLQMSSKYCTTVAVSDYVKQSYSEKDVFNSTYTSFGIMCENARRGL